jgi:hypothetical protein
MKNYLYLLILSVHIGIFLVSVNGLNINASSYNSYFAYRNSWFESCMDDSLFFQNRSFEQRSLSWFANDIKMPTTFMGDSFGIENFEGYPVE